MYGVDGLKKLCIVELLLRKHGKKWRHCLTQSIMQGAAVKVAFTCTGQPDLLQRKGNDC